MALNGFSEVLISPNISCHFELVLVLMTIQSVVDSLHKFPIGFIEIFSHFIEIPHVVIQDDMDLQGHRKRHCFMKVPEMNFKVKYGLLTSGVAELFGDDSKVEFSNSSEVVEKGLSLNRKHSSQLLKI